MDQGVVNPKQLELIIIKRKKSKEFTQRTQRDHEETNSRRRRFGIFYDQIYQILNRVFLETPKQKELLNFAMILAKKHKLQIDRLAKRTYTCLICWFCEYWKIISSDVLIYKLNGKEIPQPIISNNNNANDESQNIQNGNTELRLNTDEELSSEPIFPVQNASNFLPIPSIPQFQEDDDDTLPPPQENYTPIPQENNIPLTQEYNAPPTQENIIPHKVRLPSISYLSNFMKSPNELMILNSSNWLDNLINPSHVVNNNIIITENKEDSNTSNNENNEDNQLPYIPTRFRNFYRNKD